MCKGPCSRPSLHLLRGHAARKALRENGRIILGPEADDARLDAYGLGVLEHMQRYMEGLVIASRSHPEKLLERIDTVEGLTLL